MNYNVVSEVVTISHYLRMGSVSSVAVVDLVLSSDPSGLYEDFSMFVIHML